VFLNSLIEFAIVSFAVFIIVKQINRFNPPAPTTRECPFCLMKIPIKAVRCGFCTSDLKSA
jgi:large conductance mechanosensitive channel